MVYQKIAMSAIKVSAKCPKTVATMARLLARTGFADLPVTAQVYTSHHRIDSVEAVCRLCHSSATKTM